MTLKTTFGTQLRSPIRNASLVHLHYRVEFLNHQIKISKSRQFKIRAVRIKICGFHFRLPCCEGLQFQIVESLPIHIPMFRQTLNNHAVLLSSVHVAGFVFSLFLFHVPRHTDFSRDNVNNNSATCSGDIASCVASIAKMGAQASHPACSQSILDVDALICLRGPC